MIRYMAKWQEGESGAHERTRYLQLHKQARYFTATACTCNLCYRVELEQSG